MNLWSEATPEGCNVWVASRDMYDCICLVATNKGDTDVVIEIDFTDSKGVAPLVSTDPLAPSSSLSPLASSSRFLTIPPPPPPPSFSSSLPQGFGGHAGPSPLPHGFPPPPPSSSSPFNGTAVPTTNIRSQTIRTCRSHLALKQTTVVAVFRPEVPFEPMQLSFRVSVVGAARKEDEVRVDNEGGRVLEHSSKQSEEVAMFLRSREQRSDP